MIWVSHIKSQEAGPNTASAAALFMIFGGAPVLIATILFSLLLDVVMR